MSSRLEKFGKPMEINLEKKVSNETDDFWEDCIDTLKLNEFENKKADNSLPSSNNPDEAPEDYITCIISFIYLIVN
jgi:hypothetical protein